MITHCISLQEPFCQENVFVAERFKRKSAIEQMALDIAWTELMQNSYSNLRAFLFVTQQDQSLFRQIVVNCVIATDSFDPELLRIQQARWERTCVLSDGHQHDDESETEVLNSKATLVVESIVQASNVSHALQHWSIYKKWNKSLFQEMHGAFVLGRTVEDPAVGWHQKELDFFDGLVIPLATRLKESRVFGAFSDEYLNVALGNRQEWENRGKALLEEMKESLASQTNVEL